MWGHAHVCLKEYGCPCYSQSVLKKYPKFGTYIFVTLVGLFLAWYLFTLTENQTFLHEEWTWLADRSHLSLHALLDENFGHMSLVPATVYLIIFHLFGLDSYEVFRLVLVSFHLATILFVFGFIRRRHGLVIGGSLSVALALLGTGAQNFIWTLQIGLVSGFLFFLISLRCLEKAESSEGSKWAIISCLTLGISAASAGSGMGALFVLCMLTLFGGKSRRLWWVGLLPTFFFVIWYFLKVDSSSLKPKLHLLPSYIWQLASEAVAGFFGVGAIFGGLAFAGMCIYLFRQWRCQKVSLRTLSFPLYICFYWATTAYARAGIAPASSSRYVYIGVVSLVLVVSENVEPMLEKKLPRLWVIQSVVVVMAVLSIWGTHSELRNYKEFHSSVSLQSAGRLVIAEAHQDDIDNEATLVSFLDYPAVLASGYFQAIDYFMSSPVAQFRDLAKASEDVRYGADQMLFEFGFAAIDGPLQKNGDCLRRVLDNQPLVVSPGSYVDIHVGRTTAVTMVRFSDLNSYFPVAQRILEPGSYVISLDADDLGESLRAKFDDPTAVMTCD